MFVEEDGSRYLSILYSNGLTAPAWLVSDGMLRLFALTMAAYSDDVQGTFLIEEPENGMHPQAMQTVLDSLQSM